MKMKFIFFAALLVFILVIPTIVFSPTTASSLIKKTINYTNSSNPNSAKPTWIVDSSKCKEVTNSHSQFKTFFYMGIIMVLVAVLIYYLIAHVYSSNVLISKSKNEIYTILDHLSFAGLLILFILILSPVLLGSVSYINHDPIYGSSTTPKNLVMAAMDISNFITHRITTEYAVLLIYNAKINSLYSATMWFGVTWMSTWQFNLGPALRPAIDAIGMSLTFLSMSIVEWVVKGAFLCFINKWGIFLILFGAFLTTIPLTRNIGRIILALFFSFMIIYPVMIILNYEAYKIIITSPQLGNLSIVSLSNATMVKAVLFAIPILGSASAPIYYFFITEIISTSISMSIMYVFLFSFFLPFLNITVTLTYANEVAKSFGLTTNFMQFMRLI